MRNFAKKTRVILMLLSLMTLSLEAFTQELKVHGKVTDASSGDVLPGVNITVKGTTRGTSTDVDGSYTIMVPKSSILVYSYVGFFTQEITVTDQIELNVALSPDIAKLNEVVVIGYGTVKKSDLTGSVSSLGSQDFNKGSITSPQDLMIGKIPGVVVTSGDGAPGSSATIRIRGGSSIKASSDPLIVIDGVPVDKYDISGLPNPLAAINPNDIESFTVLKDASATAIYGSRASSGVIIITTKKGGAGKLKISYNGTASLYTVPKMIEVLSASEYRALVESQFSAGASLMGSASTDWQKEIYQTAFGHDHNLSFSGTVKNLPYRASVGYTNEDGILKTSNLDRTTLSIGLSPSFLDDHLHFNLNAKGFYNKTRFANTGAIGAAVQFDPTHPVKDGDNYWTWMSGTLINDQAVDNPVAELMLTSDVAKVYRSIGNLQTDYKFHFLPDLRANLNLAYDYTKTDGKKFTPENTSWTSSFKGNHEKYTQQKQMQLLEFYLNYTKEITQDQKVDVTAGYSWQHFWRKKYDYATSVDETLLNDSTSYKTQNYIISFFGRANYTLLDRYLVTVTLRDDGSSKFAKDNRWGLFPSVALAWKISSEPFMAGMRNISNLKLRLGYGVTGQEDIVDEDYPYLARYTRSSDDKTAQYQFGNIFYNTLRPEGYDKNIKWESTTTYNIGLDFGFFNNRFSGTFDLYDRKTKDLLNKIPIPAGSNLQNELLTNVGNMKNKGIEFTINANILTSKDLNWEVSYNIGYNKNEITKLILSNVPTYPGDPAGDISGGVGNKIQINSVGHPMNSFYVYKQVYNSEGKPIEGLYVDQNGDGVINSSDLYCYKKPAADVLMGISSRLSYKNWDFSFAGRLSLGNYVYNNVASSRGTYYDVYNGGTHFLSNVVKQVNDTKFNTTQYFSDYYIENGSFFRMDNINLGYQFSNLLNKGLNIHLSLAVQNAFIITKYKGLDPEVFNGIDNNLYPRPRTFIVGANIQF